mmetsp:Transcript_9076/g.18210  ORF Transcript_9076/g.18210 Transcript_9076/m.18210 type:complete len:245 (+) Transcript_9076:2460-3194(+)
MNIINTSNTALILALLLNHLQITSFHQFSFIIQQILHTLHNTKVMSHRWIMPTLSLFQRISNHCIRQITRITLQLRQSNFTPLLLRSQMSKLIFNRLLHILWIQITHNIQQDIIRTIMRPMPSLDIIPIPLLDQTFLSNGETLCQSILTMECTQYLTFDTIFNGVDHGHFREDGLTFLFDTGGITSCLHDIAQCIKCHGEHGLGGAEGSSVGTVGGTCGVKDGVMEIGVGVGLTSGAEETFTFA